MLYVVDSGAVMNDESFYFEEDKRYVTTPAVLREFKDFRSKSLVDNAIKTRILKIMTPYERFVNEAKNVLRETRMRLSETDLSVVALATQLQRYGKQALVLTDDYSVQNYCKLKGIPFKGAAMGEIKAARRFGFKCRFCGKKLRPDFKGSHCPACRQRL